MRRSVPAVTVAPMTLAHDVTGSGPAVLLIHSTVCDRRMWDPQVPVLAAAGHRVLRCDLRGYGDSPMPAAPNDDTAEVAELLAALGITRVAVVGSSGGGQVALDLAARRPELVSALALLCTARPGHERSARLRAFGDREDALLAAGDVEAATELNVETWVGPEADDKVRAQVREMQRHAFEVQLAAGTAQPADGTAQPADVGSPARSNTAADSAGLADAAGTADPAGPAGVAEADASADVGADAGAGNAGAADAGAANMSAGAADVGAAGEQHAGAAGLDLSAIVAPTLLISGAHDLPDFREIAVHLAGALPHARHLELDWAGHLPSMERPDLINPLLLDFLAERH